MAAALCVLLYSRSCFCFLCDVSVHTSLVVLCLQACPASQAGCVLVFGLCDVVAVV